MTSLPEGADGWTDEQWLAWLVETDAAADAEAARDDAAIDAERRRPPAPRRRRLGSQLVSAAMTGLAEAIYGPKDKHAIVIEAAGDPPDDDPMTVHLDPDHPERSVVVVRPWLLRRTRRARRH